MSKLVHMLTRQESSGTGPREDWAGGGRAEAPASPSASLASLAESRSAAIRRFGLVVGVAGGRDPPFSLAVEDELGHGRTRRGAVEMKPRAKEARDG